MSESIRHDKISVRQIMRDLRELSVRDLTPEARLDKIVALVARKMRVDVCSCYIARPGDILELCATFGLDKRAVHETFLRVGEGLVGEIALQRKPLMFEDAWAHSSFVYKPETKEKAFKSLAGVPLIRSNKLLGVLAVQTRKKQPFSDEVIEILETIGLVVAEMLSSHLFKKAETVLAQTTGRQKIEGTGLISGFAVGRAVIHKRLEQPVQLLAKDTQKEVQRLLQALSQVEQEVNKILATSHMTGSQSDIFETYLMFIKDKGWIAKMTKAIETGLTAEAAVQKVGEEVTDRMELMTDPYIKERIHDLQDLVSRVMRHLHRRAKKAKHGRKMPHNTILVAQSMGPAELMDYDLKKIKGIVLEEGSQTMHMVIVTRSMNIPLICGIKNVTEIISNGDSIALDATNGNVYLNPSDDTLDLLSEQANRQRRLRAKYTQMKDLPAITLDEVPVSLNINAGLSQDLTAGNLPYDGIGLYRTELPFMLTEQLPNAKTQTDIYRRVLIQAKDKPVIFRTLDIGSDKVLPYFRHQAEENPAMGWRSIRMTLDRRALLRNQLRAFLRAAAGRDLSIMFPMIATVPEFREAKKTLMMEIEQEQARGGRLPKSIRIGSMLEVPSLIFQLETLLPEVDFISIGTNDLTQFLYASDRGNPTIWNRYDPLSPAFLRVLKYVVEICRKAHVPCSVCGEMAGRPLEAMTLIGLGYQSLSMNPTSLGAVKAMVRSVNQRELSDYLNQQLSLSVDSLREQLRIFALDHGIFIG
ncbi:MAG: phosphoenolpyruvate--protein phosphotransferase [Alphaproteobacteria bacterium]|nr:phosphoenolpyruvate--protein phosphotransferase [Alphaproteobacteria bacterium]